MESFLSAICLDYRKMEEKKERLQMAKRILEKHANWFFVG
jgi:hypothetical protein